MQNRSLTNLEIAGNTIKSIFSIAFSPLDALWGLRVGYKASKNKNQSLHADKLDDLVPNAAWGSRIGALLLVTGFIIALAVPIPGLGPVYALMAGATAKLFGVSLAGLIGRTVGATIGSCVDLSRFKKIESATKQDHLKSDSRFNWKYPFKAGFRMGLFGESVIEANTVIKFLGKWKEKLCCRFRSKKTTAPINNDGESREREFSNPHNSIASRSSSRGSTFHTVKAMAKTQPVNVGRLDSFGYIDAADPRVVDVGSLDGSVLTPGTGSHVTPTPDQVASPVEFINKSTLTFSPTGSRQD
jgi:hypothetical protein